MIRVGKPSWKFEGSNAELQAMTRDLDDAHQEVLPAMRAGAAELGDNLRGFAARTGLGRRRFVLGTGALGLTVVLAGCGGDDDEAAAPADNPNEAPADAAVYEGDLKIVAFAAALENQAIVAYQAALDAAAAGGLGEVPAAVGVFAQTAQKQHSDHVAAWNGVLTSASLPEITGVPLSNHQMVLDALGQVTDVGQVAKLALTLEDEAAATYLLAVGAVSDMGGIATAATIAPVESMHAAILRYVLGEYPVPETFISTDKAASPATFTA